jgi:hypothetical protein
MNGESTITNKTLVSIGTVAILGGIVWWGATISSKVDSIIAMQTQFSLSLGGQRKDIDAMSIKLVEFDKLGSPALVPRINSLEKQMIEVMLRLNKTVNERTQ